MTVPANGPGTTTAPAPAATAPAAEPAPAAASATAPESTPAPAAEPTSPAPSDPKVLTIPSNAMRKIKEEERNRGRQETLAELDATAVAEGFANHAEMIAHAKAAKLGQAQKPEQAPKQEAAQPKAPEDTKSLEALKAEHERTLREKKKLNRQHNRTQRELVRTREALAEKDAEKELALAAKDAGVADVDYAVSVLRRSLQGMSPEDLKSFDEGKFFRETLRTSHPHLYQAEQRPVTTGNGPGTQAPTPGVVKQEPEKKQADARALTPQQFNDRLRTLGLSNPKTGGVLS